MASIQPRTIRYGVIFLPFAVSFEQVLRATVRAEEIGFDSVWIPDHLQRQEMSALECWSTICGLAARTHRIRIGSLATCNSFRNPALLARIIATASEIARGRIDLAIGLGYDESELTSNGYPFPSYKDRAGMLSESIQILELFWKQKRVSFDGDYYKLRNSLGEPKPEGELKLWLAGRNKKVLKLAAEYAYGVNILPYSGVMEKRVLSTFEELKEISDEIDSFAGKKRNRIPKSIYGGDGGVVIGSDRTDYSKQLEKYASQSNQSFSQITEKVQKLSLIHGTVEECKASIAKLASLGFEETMMVFPGWQSGDYSNMELFANEFIHS